MKKQGENKNSSILKTAVTLIVIIVAAIFGGKQFVGGGEDDTKKDVSIVADVSDDNEDEQLTPKDSGTKETEAEKTEAEKTETPTEAPAEEIQYTFYSDELLESHFEKHGDEFDYATAEEYEQAASDVINSPDALHKTEKEDGDDVYYIPETNEFVVLSTSGFIRTYFKPTDGMDYYERQ